MTDLQEWQKNLFTQITQTTASPSRGLGIYQHAYRSRIGEALGNDFPLVKKTLGTAQFENLVGLYLRDYPSRVTHLGEIGRDFPLFLKKTRADFTAELAKLEWAAIECFYADKAPPLDLPTLAALPTDAWATLAFELSFAHRILTLDYPFAQLWASRESEESFVQSEKKLVRAKTVHLVFCAEVQVEVIELTFLQASLLKQIRDLKPLGEIFSSLTFGNEELAPAVQESFSKWMQIGLITAMRHKT
jgi:hypothetical protein